MIGTLPDNPRARQWFMVLLFALPVIAGFAVYAGSLKNAFVWDDPIVLGQQLQAFHSLKDIFFPPPRIPQFGHLYYRPMIVVSYVFDRWFWGDTPFGFHFPVVLFHALNCGLVFLLGWKLFGRAKGGAIAASAGALLFATHPIHTESVCWMAGRSDTMAALFLIPALLAYFAWKRRRGSFGYLALAAVLYLGACLVKESALGLLFIVVAADVLGIGDPREESRSSPSGGDPAAAARATQSEGGRAASRREKRSKERGGRDRAVARASAQTDVSNFFAKGLGWGAFAVATVVYFAIRSSALAAEADPLRPQNPDPIASLVNLLRATGFYVAKIFVPTHLDAYIPNIPAPGLSLVLGLLGVSAASAAILYSVMRGRPLVAFLLIWFFGALAPSLAIAFFQISEAPVAERYLYFPSVGFCLLAGYLAFVALPAALPEGAGRMALYAACAATLAVSAAYGIGTVVRGRVWRTDLDFWADGIAKSPNEGLPHLHMGLAYANLKQDDLAEKEYMLAIDPSIEYDAEGRSTALNNLGMLYMGRHDYAKADEFFDRAIRMRPDYPTPYYGLGVTNLRRAEEMSDKSGQGPYLRKSEESLRHAIDLNPQYVKAHNQLAFLLANTRRQAEALQHLDLVLRLVSRGNEYEFAVQLKKQLSAGPGAGGGAAR